MAQHIVPGGAGIQQDHPAPATAPPRRHARSGVGRQQPSGYLYVLPAVIIFVVFLGVAIVETVWYSFYDWDGIGTSTWVGLANYATVLTDPQINQGYLHILILLVFYAALPVVLGLFLTLVLARGSSLRGIGAFRTFLFLPQVISTVVVATIWISIYSDGGLLNETLRTIGLGKVTHSWLGDFNTALFAIGLIGTWTNVGLCMVIFLGGVQAIEPDVFKAAQMDGAGPVSEFRAITLPALRGHIAVALTLTVINTLKTFDIVYVTTQGGPGNSTTVPAFEAFNRAFTLGQVGSASAVAVILTIVIMVVSWLINLLQPKEIG